MAAPFGLKASLEKEARFISQSPSQDWWKHKVKRLAATIIGLALSAATLFLLEFFLLRQPMIYSIRITFGLNLAICTLFLVLWKVMQTIFKKPQIQPTANPSKKEIELEEKLTYLSKVYQDLSNSLRIEKQKVELIISCAPDGIFTITPDGIVSSWNRSMENLTGLAEQVVVGRAFRDSVEFFSSQGDLLVNPFHVCVSEGKTISILDCLLETRDGKSLPVALSAAPLPRLRSGKMVHGQKPEDYREIIITVKDIRVQKQAEKLKQDMMAMITHDLRSPLSAILGYVSLLQHPKLAPNEEERKKHLEAITRAGKGMLLLINNLLQTAGMEEGKIVVRKEEIKLKPLLDEIIEELNILARGKNLKLLLEAPFDLKLCTDPEKLREILTNLIVNAIKFSRAEESIHIKAQKQGDEIKISVSDSGPGISEEEKAKLFEKFSSVRKAGSTTGLGLFIVSRLTEALHGTVELESQPGVGSTFTISLPCGKITADSEADKQLSLLSKT
jgi:PAS domain S-box-containing protein